MGRRALPKIDPALDLSKHLLSADGLPQPWNATDVFGREAPLEVEVGTGKGLFVCGAAESHREHNFLGIEIAKKYAHYAAAQLVKCQVDNARILAGDGLHFFHEVLPNECVSAVHVYFPDPWWKKRHHKRRVMNEHFLQDVQRVLVPNGVLHFWTDVLAYFDESLKLMSRTNGITGPVEVEESLARYALEYRTHFDRRMHLNGAPVYRSEFRKAAT